MTRVLRGGGYCGLKERTLGRLAGGSARVRKSDRVPEEIDGEGKEGESIEACKGRGRGWRGWEGGEDGGREGGEDGEATETARGRERPHNLVLPFTFYGPLIALMSPSNHAANCLYQLHSCNIMNIP